MSEEYLVGDIEAIYFENPSNFYKVVRITVDIEESTCQDYDAIVITGYFPNLQFETTYQFYGQMTRHPKYGEQFAVSHYQQITPTSKQGLIEYLSGPKFKGVGPVLAERIVDKLGEDALSLIASDRSVLDGIPGLKKAVADQMYEQIHENEGSENALMHLSQWGFGPALAEKIYRRYEANAIELLKENPYRLVEDIEGIGFRRADQLAEQLGFPADADERIIAAIYEAVQDLTFQNGDTYVDEAEALLLARTILENGRSVLIDDALLQKGLHLAVAGEHLQALDNTLLLPSVYYAELNTANQIERYLKYEQVDVFSDDAIHQAMDQLMSESMTPYDTIQQQTLMSTLKSPMTIITGGPGTGKTTLVKGIIRLYQLLTADVDTDKEDAISENSGLILLAAPTGRAAKRMQETTGLNATTIHRLIGFNRESDQTDFFSEELEGSLLIIDEMSMVDVWLMNWLMQAIPYHMRVVFVGDQDQLPSVGPGRVFADLIEANVIPVQSLEKIYRQEEDSTIVPLAHTVRQGYLPNNFLSKTHDRTFIRADAQQIGTAVSQIVHHAIASGFNKTDIQILAPKYKGPGGINEINQLLQEQLNPPKRGKREMTYFDRVFRVGDRVLQLVNDTDRGVFNGDIGYIEMIMTKEETDSKMAEMVVMFDDREMTYQASELGQLTLAYCMSIHKSQGSEYPLIIIPLVDKYSRLLRKDILYTAITRASDRLILIGDPESFHIAVTKEQPPRKTLLKELLEVKMKKMNVSAEDAVESDSNKLTKKEVATKETTIKKEPINQLTEDNTASTNDATSHLNEPEQLTLDNVNHIDPMIGMEKLTPWEFMA